MLGETMVAVIPAYEPGVTLLSIAQEIRKKKMELIIVDDGSGCEYDDLFHRLREFAYVIRYPENRGKGHALKTAFSYLSGDRTGQYSVVLLDCDIPWKMRFGWQNWPVRIGVPCFWDPEDSLRIPR